MKEQIIKTLLEKSQVKQMVYDNTKEAFKTIKGILQDIVSEYNADLINADKRVLLEYRDRGVFEAEIRIAGDLLIFNMHSNIFEFPREHQIWKAASAKEDPLSTYSGIINIYNFLADSFKYNRAEDVGYLIGRIFINKNNHYFIEGQKELGSTYPSFDENKTTEETLKKVIDGTILYALKFDLLVPPLKNIQLATVNQMKERINKSKIQTGKRVGFNYNTED
ncbi:MAG: hypothetical protein PF448_10920 [Bacteroidales bacterium]|jgi:hypothetical protein|nr:hypothetical protein [Bacteroidales bacterium]